MHMLANLAVAVFRYEKVRTTEAKAKEVRSLVDRMITVAKKGDLSARRALIADMPHEPLIVEKLMGELATKYADRTSGYTRIMKIGQRLGDAAPIVQIELV
jgi:ribosomal protein L17